MQAHFENIQRISDTITLPHAMHNLSLRIAEELDLSHLLERLIQGKGQPNTLTQSEKLDLWGRLKILSMNLVSAPIFIIAILIHLVAMINEELKISILLRNFFSRFHKNGIVSMGNSNA